MASIYDRVVAVISKPFEFRADFECQELVPWFRNKSVLFESLKPDIIIDVIRHCTFQRRQVDDVIIKQGEDGDSLFIILKGQLSIYVIQDKDDSGEILQHVQKACAKPELERHLLGQKVWTTGDGKTVGEVALLKDDCVRTASVVIDKETDLIVIDRALYNRSVRTPLEKEYTQKTSFVEENPNFRQWPAKQKRQLVISLKKEVMKWNCPMTKQGAKADNVYFILSGEVEITVDQSVYKTQYSSLWSEMEDLLPGLLPRTYGMKYTPHQSMRRKQKQRKLLQMCLLGSNEIIGVLEVILGLNTYTENAVVTREAEVLVLSKENYERLFKWKYAALADRNFRDMLTMRLYLHIHRSDLFISSSPFLKFLTFLLQDSGSLKLLKKQKRRPSDAVGSNHRDTSKHQSSIEPEKLKSMLKILKITHASKHGRLPEIETSQRVINEIEDGLHTWISRKRAAYNFRRPQTRPPSRQRTFLGTSPAKDTDHERRTNGETEVSAMVVDKSDITPNTRNSESLSKVGCTPLFCKPQNNVWLCNRSLLADLFFTFKPNINRTHTLHVLCVPSDKVQEECHCEPNL